MELIESPLLQGPGLLENAGQMFPDPFLDMASLVMPRQLVNILNLCEGIWLKNGTYRMAAQRIVRYFITSVEFREVSEDQKAKLDNFLKNKFRLTEQLALIGDDFLGYGNSFTSIVIPFRRYLICTECKMQSPIEKLDWTFENWDFHAHCPKCRKKTKQNRIDLKSSEEDKISVKRWAPQQIRLLAHPYANVYEYYWKIPRHISSEIAKGNRFYVQHMPWEVIEAVKQDALFKFNNDVIHHMHEDTLAGVETKGWGISRLMGTFAQAWYTQVLKRYNEALAADYVIPFRLITPAMASSKTADPLLQINMPSFVGKVNSLVRAHRRDPAGWNVLPFPIQYQALGGEAKALATPELMGQAMDEMLNAIGIPADLYKGTLQLQAFPTALRLFQQTWPQLVHQMNAWVDWAVKIICGTLNWNAPDRASLAPVTLSDDIELRQVWLQLAASNMISRNTAFQPFGINASDEQQKIFAEQADFAKQQQKFEEDMQRRQMNKDIMKGMMPPPGAQGMPPDAAMPMGSPSQLSAGSGMGMTPEDLMGQADAMAQQLVRMPYEARRREMMNIKDTNQTLHALVKQKMENIRNEASTVGGQAVIQGQV